ncbi:MAG: helix-turn-helix domain-containing protein [Sediminimonas qiaohouensis]|uniref:Helix-turn-helix domain-containing protein n=1 Tax=Sediminimonas qiaohouensis TaxID=552061 RepID=A0A7C9HC35_9RHOB|nr:helix-turn-helix domain-containing protein [Sediminimonas qiaohouensis]
MRHGTRQLSGERARHGAWRLATGLVLRRHVAGFYSAVDKREGIAKAKAAGKYKGRAPTARAKSDDVLALKAKGVGPSEIARRVGIGRASVYRILADA